MCVTDHGPGRTYSSAAALALVQRSHETEADGSAPYGAHGYLPEPPWGLPA